MCTDDQWAITFWALSQYKDRLSQVWGFPCKKIRRSPDRLIFSMGIHPYTGKTTSLYWEGPLMTMVEITILKPYHPLEWQKFTSNDHPRVMFATTTDLKTSPDELKWLQWAIIWPFSSPNYDIRISPCLVISFHLVSSYNTTWEKYPN